MRILILALMLFIQGPVPTSVPEVMPLLAPVYQFDQIFCQTLQHGGQDIRRCNVSI